MKITSSSMLLMGSLLLGVTPGVIASKNEEALAQKLQIISEQAEQLQREMKILKEELRALKEEKKAQTPIQQQLPAASKSRNQYAQAPQVQAGDDAPSPLTQMPYYQPRLNAPTLAPTVTTSPYIGLRSAFDASDLVVNVPTMGEDLRLLRERVALRRKLGGGLPFEDRPVIVISGKLEALAYARRDYEAVHHSDIDLGSSELDFLVQASPWALGFISMAYDNTFLDSSLVNSPVGRRISNSNIFLKRGFITLGNLEKFPIYLSAGQMYLNFGRYGSALVTPALTQILGQTNERQIQLGYAKEDGLSFSGYAYKGSSNTGNRNTINEGGVNARYIKELGNNRSVSFGAGYISTISDAAGVQITSLPYPRQGFAPLNEFLFLENETLVRRAPALNLHGEYAVGPWTLMAEYVGTVRAFDVANFSFNDEGASPKALHLELNRKFSIFDKPANISVAWGRSWQALAIGLPTNKYSFVFNVSPVKNTILSIEFSRFKNYAEGSTAYIKGTDIPLIYPDAPYVSPGGFTNLILAQLGLYF